jgi:hypothetical protein
VLVDPVLKAKYPSHPFVSVLPFTSNRPKRKNPPPVPVTLAPVKVAEPVSMIASPAAARVMAGKVAYRFEPSALSAVPLPQVGDAVPVLLRMVVADVVAHGPATGVATAPRDNASDVSAAFVYIRIFGVMKYLVRVTRSGMTG